MDVFVPYMLFSIFDVVAIHVLILKLYRLPLRRYSFQLIGLFILLALSSFIIRVHLNLLAWDVPLQYIISVLFYCYVLKYRLHYAAFIVGAGWSAYLMIQHLIYYYMKFIGVVDQSLLFANTGFVVHKLQLSAAIVAISIAIFFKSTGRGFSFILPPPHDKYKIKYTEYSHLIVLVSGLISAVILCLEPTIRLSQNYRWVIFLLIGNFVLSYYLSDRGDYESVRDALEKYRKKIKAKQP